MGFLDRLLGRDQPAAPAVPSPPPTTGGTDDERAVERYRYLLRTAPPEQIEQAHSEAFANLTPEQRREVLTSLSAQDPQGDRQSDDPASLARMATRAEMRQPGTLERSFGGGGGMGMGGLLAGSLLASVAGSVIGTSIAASMFDESSGADEGGVEAGGEGDSSGSGEEQAAGDASGDYGGDGGGDFGGDLGGGFGGDFGG